MPDIKSCKVEGCDAKHYGLEYCKKHYQRFKKYGDPNHPTIIKDGRYYHPLYGTYRDMIRRCYYKGREDYPYYGGRGIKMCNRWLDREQGFWSFAQDMGKKPTKKHSIDRIDVDGNYEPENCRWATQSTQIRNSRSLRNTSGCVGVS